ncbi:MAG TPA: small, acid-soluble spore protein, alpha/beta type [Symbiobacteriaceae bacterium]|nr:small, acid-soluble spore protein, alpha/beta type [Symbiobacteriaceae bacterium]
MPSVKKAKATSTRKPKELTPLDLLKLEIASELGLADKVASEGWGGLTAVETGRVGGILNRKLKERQMAIGPKGSLIPAE